MRPILSWRDTRAIPATAVAALGFANIALGFTAPLSAPTVFLLQAHLGGVFAPIVSGLVLVLLAGGLLRGLGAARLVTLALLLPVALSAPLAHNDWALSALVPMAMLLVYRSRFGAVSRAPWRGGAAMLAGIVLLSLAGSAFQGAFGLSVHRLVPVHIVRAADRDDTVVVHRPLPTGPDLWLALPAAGLGGLVILFGLAGLTLPGLPRRATDERRARALAERLFETHETDGVSYFALSPDKTVWTDPSGRGAVAFRLFGGTALVIGDPLAALADRSLVLEGFLSYCRAHGLTPAFYQTRAGTLPTYRTRGFHALGIGREAIIDLPAFTLSGKRIANVRHSVTHAERAGLSVRLFDGDRMDEATRGDLLDISTQWLARRGGGEMGFTMGRLSRDGRPTPGARVAVAYDAAGQAQAFITVVPIGGGCGWMLDLMRRRNNAVSGTMDLLITRMAEALRDEGFATFSLSLAPLASADGDDEDAPAAACRARGLLYEKMNGAYNYRSLFTYKNKFNVRWETRYLVYAGNVALPSALYAVTRAHLPERLIALPSLPRPAFLRRPHRAVAAGSA